MALRWKLCLTTEASLSHPKSLIFYVFIRFVTAVPLLTTLVPTVASKGSMASWKRFFLRYTTIIQCCPSSKSLTLPFGPDVVVLVPPVLSPYFLTLGCEPPQSNASRLLTIFIFANLRKKKSTKTPKWSLTERRKRGGWWKGDTISETQCWIEMSFAPYSQNERPISRNTISLVGWSARGESDTHWKRLMTVRSKWSKFSEIGHIH